MVRLGYILIIGIFDKHKELRAIMKSDELRKIIEEEIELLNEEKAKAEDIATEVAMALNDFYIASIDHSGDKIHLKFPNGQKFEMTVKELTDK